MFDNLYNFALGGYQVCRCKIESTAAETIEQDIASREKKSLKEKQTESLHGRLCPEIKATKGNRKQKSRSQRET